MLQLISVVMLIYSFFLIRTSIPTLPRLIPTHFNAAGEPNSWGSPNTLWLLLGAQALTTVVFLIVPYLSQRNPGAVHFGARRLSEFPPAVRKRMASLVNQMVGILSIVVNLVLVLMLHEVIRASAQPIPRLHPFSPLAFLIFSTVVIVVYYFWKFNMLAKGEDADGSSNP
jgi:uncharacterized membrane protein